MRHFRQRPPAYARVLSALLLVLLSTGGCGGVQNIAAATPQEPTASGVATGPAARGVTAYSASIHVTENTPRAQVSASCQPGEELVGGGFVSSDTFEYAARIVASYPASDMTWTVAAASGPAFILSAEVYCVSLGASPGLVISHTRVAPSGRVSCPPGTILLSGGFQGDNVFSTSRPDGNGWYAVTSGFTGTVYDLCASRHVSAGSVVSASLDPHSSAHGYYPAAQSMKCPAGQTATAGGFSGGGLVITSASAGAPYGSWNFTAGGDGALTFYARCVMLTA